jgi:hypothetical protein
MDKSLKGQHEPPQEDERARELEDLQASEEEAAQVMGGRRDDPCAGEQLR